MTAFALAERFVGLKELPGGEHHPFIVWAHSLCGLGMHTADEVPWCSSWLNAICWLLDLPMSRSAAARSWLKVGTPVSLDDAIIGFDIVVLSRGDKPWQGHVGFYAGKQGDQVLVLGGNQSNAVTRQGFPVSRVVGVRRLA